MKNLKFRGISLDTGKMVYGYGVAILEPPYDDAVIIHKQNGNLLQNTAVNPATVGQFTGKVDGNGTDIYDGDVCCWKKQHGTKWQCNFNGGQSFSSTHDVAVVIGNIHENPELLQS